MKMPRWVLILIIIVIGLVFLAGIADIFDQAETEADCVVDPYGEGC